MSGPDVLRDYSLLESWANFTGYVRVEEPEDTELSQREKDFLSGKNAGPEGFNHRHFSNGKFKHPCPIANCASQLQNDHHPTDPLQMYKRFARLPFLLNDPFFKAFPPSTATESGVIDWIQTIYEFRHRTAVFGDPANVDAVDYLALDGKKLRYYTVSGCSSSTYALQCHLLDRGFTNQGSEYVATILIKASTETLGHGLLFMILNAIGDIPGFGWLKP